MFSLLNFYFLLLLYTLPDVLSIRKQSFILKNHKSDVPTLVVSEKMLIFAIRNINRNIMEITSSLDKLVRKDIFLSPSDTLKLRDELGLTIDEPAFAYVYININDSLEPIDFGNISEVELTYTGHENMQIVPTLCCMEIVRMLPKVLDKRYDLIVDLVDREVAYRNVNFYPEPDTLFSATYFESWETLSHALYQTIEWFVQTRRTLDYPLKQEYNK